MKYSNATHKYINTLQKQESTAELRQNIGRSANTFCSLDDRIEHQTREKHKSNRIDMRLRVHIIRALEMRSGFSVLANLEKRKQRKTKQKWHSNVKDFTSL